MRRLWRVAVAAVLISGCSCGDDDGRDLPDGGGGDAGPDAGPGSDAGPDAGSARSTFDVWREVRAAMRASPDHLPARAEALVAARDLDGLFALVRDDIQTVPGEEAALGRLGGEQIWGARATLRGGMGTPREKAELLAELLRRAGFEAEIAQGTLDPAVDPGSIFIRDTRPPFAPPVTAAQLDEWLAVLGWAPGLAPVAPLDDDASVAALGDSLAAPLAGSAPFAIGAAGTIALVRFRDMGATEWRYANPIVPDAVLGMPYTTDTPIGAAGPLPADTVRVRLSFARLDDPRTRLTLVEREYTADEVVGRRILAGFVPTVTLEELPGLAAEDIDVVVPTISVDGQDIDDALHEMLGEVGTPVSRGGDVYEIRADGTVLLDGVSLGAGTMTDPAALARVSTVEVRANASAFPRVVLRVRALDSSGVNVPDLMTDAFTVRDDATPRPFTVRANRAPAPRVLFLFDNSTSVPAEYRGAGAVSFGTTIADAILAAHPDATVRAAVISFGARLLGPWVGSSAELQTQIMGITGGSSDIWAALADVNEDARPTVIVMITDGMAVDVLTPERRASIAEGAPIVALGVGPVDMTTLDLAAALTDGIAARPTTPAEAATIASTFAIDRATYDYELVYRAPLAGMPMRIATVRVDDRVEGSATYTVPAMPAAPPRVSGVYLTIETTGGRSEVRTLGGWDPTLDAALPITEEMLDSAEAALLSMTTLTVEGAPPPPSIWADERLSELLALEPLAAAIRAGDDEGIRAAIAGRLSATPLTLMHLSAATGGMASDTHLTFPTGLSIAALTVVPRVSEEAYERTTDVFPLGRWSTISRDDGAAWRATVDHGVRVALIEAGLMQTSTRSELAGETLRAVDPTMTATMLSDLAADRRDRWRVLLTPFGGSYTALLPMDGDPYAAWLTHDRGTLVGILDRGAGEGRAYDMRVDMLETAFTIIGAMGAPLGPAFGAWAALERTKLRMLIAATAIIAGEEITMEDWVAIGTDLGCELTIGGLDAAEVFDGIPGASRALERLDDAYIVSGTGRAMGVDTPMIDTGIPCL